MITISVIDDVGIVAEAPFSFGSDFARVDDNFFLRIDLSRFHLDGLSVREYDVGAADRVWF